MLRKIVRKKRKGSERCLVQICLPPPCLLSSSCPDFYEAALCRPTQRQAEEAGRDAAGRRAQGRQQRECRQEEAERQRAVVQSRRRHAGRAVQAERHARQRRHSMKSVRRKELPI